MSSPVHKRTLRPAAPSFDAARGRVPDAALALFPSDLKEERDRCGVGFVASLRRQPSREVVSIALSALRRLVHRGAVGADPRTGDGAGLLVQVPDQFFRRVLAPLEISLPTPGR
jgi:glutamate synthase domain-containing protein 1